MSDTGRDLNLVPDDVQANYRALRAHRGCTWDELADELERNCEGLEPWQARSYQLIADWARAQQAGDDRRAGTTPQPAGPKPKRDTRQQPPPRKAA